jgi:choline-sulfatase
MTSPANMVVIMTDQHSPKMLGCAGHTQVKTPNLDALASGGTRFISAYTASPLCVPARAALATGRYVHQIGCWDNSIAWTGLPLGWPQRLPAAGHRTVSIGKLHYRNDEDPVGFSERVVPMHIADGVGDLQGSIRPDLPVRLQGRKLAEDVGPGETSYTAYDRDITARTAAWLADAAANPPADADGRVLPWVLYVSMICPHFPLSAPQEFYDLYDPDAMVIPKPFDAAHAEAHPWWRAFHASILFDSFFKDDDHRRRAVANYYGLVSFADDNVGRILAAIEANGLAGSTRIAYTSDHGDSLGARGIWGKSTMHEESAGVPMILAGPGIPAGKTVRTPVSLLDIYPTLLDCVGLATGAPEDGLPGASLLGIANAADDDDRAVLSEYHAAGAISGAFMLRRGGWKYIHYVGCPPELYDLAHDPEEMVDLAGDPRHAAMLTELEAVLRATLAPETPESIDAHAKRDQAARVAAHGGREAILGQSPIHGSPVPGGASTRVA